MGIIVKHVDFKLLHVQAILLLQLVIVDIGSIQMHVLDVQRDLVLVHLLQ